MPQCSICGGRFAEHKCIYCNKPICSSCMNVDTNKCMNCKDRRTIPMRQFVRRNMILFIFLGSIWVFTVYPWPFLCTAANVCMDISAIQPILIVSLVLVIPFLFMLMAWQRKPPR